MQSCCFLYLQPSKLNPVTYRFSVVVLLFWITVLSSCLCALWPNTILLGRRALYSISDLVWVVWTCIQWIPLVVLDGNCLQFSCTVSVCVCLCVCRACAHCVYGCRGEGQELKLGAQTSVRGTRIQAAVETNKKLVCYFKHCGNVRGGHCDLRWNQNVDLPPHSVSSFLTNFLLINISSISG